MKNVAITGFMGTGKTSMGKMLAGRLGYAFVDLDKAIEKEARKSIPQIFKDDGEGYFRQLEKDTLKKCLQRRHLVLSTGGGTVKDPDNRALIHETCMIICLTASPTTILRRTAKHGERPVLDGKDHGDRLKAIEELIKSREGIYSDADYTIDTSELSPMQVMNDAANFLKRRGIPHA